MYRALQPHEHLDDLMYKGLRILQSDHGFKFGMDAVLLSDFARPRAGKMLDLCTGTGVVALLCAARHENIHITALELQEESAALARESVLFNGLQQRIDVLQGDLRHHERLFVRGAYETVTVNPPYNTCTQGPGTETEARRIARQEETCTLDDVLQAADYALKFGGRLFMVIRSDRAVDALCAMRAHHLEPKRALLVCHSPQQKPSLLLLEGKKGGKPTLTWEEPLCICDEAGRYTPRARAIYHLPPEEDHAG